MVETKKFRWSWWFVYIQVVIVTKQQQWFLRTRKTEYPVYRSDFMWFALMECWTNFYYYFCLLLL